MIGGDRMQTIQALDDEGQLTYILNTVEKGETVVIERNGRAVARVSPAPISQAEHPEDFDRERFQRAKTAMLELRKRIKPISIEEILSAKNEGRM